jgi:Stage II sporulation protein E (SpoIIE)
MSFVLPRLLRRWRVRLARVGDRTVLLFFVALALLGTLWSFLDYSHVRVPSIAIIIMVFSSLVLTGRAMIGVVALLAGCITCVLVFHDQVSSQLTFSGLVMLLSVAVVSIVQAVRRDSLGLRRMSAETVLGRVGAQLREQGRVPPLPDGWHVDVAKRSAGGAAFAGDFVCSRVHDVDARMTLDVVVVDVSGRGIEAGSRALLLSGAVGGLLGAVGPQQFLTKVNEYLRGQGVTSAFSTASYVRVDLSTGAYVLHSAGHPPPVLWSAATESTKRSTSSGIVLGVVDDLDDRPDGGVLEPGDALVLYTDGVVEERSLDIEAGIERLEIQTCRTLRARTVARLADELVEHAPGNDDDQTVVVIWNSARVRTSVAGAVESAQEGLGRDATDRRVSPAEASRTSQAAQVPVTFP